MVFNDSSLRIMCFTNINICTAELFSPVYLNHSTPEGFQDRYLPLQSPTFKRFLSVI